MFCRDPTKIGHLKRFEGDVEVDAAARRHSTANVTPHANRVAAIGVGPAGMTTAHHLRRQRVIEYAARRQPEPPPSREDWPDLGREYHDCSQPLLDFTSEQIQEVLNQVDKCSPDDELNCGACGYVSCRVKAIPALRGMAERTMCIPYVRSRAESLTNVVIDVRSSRSGSSAPPRKGRRGAHSAVFTGAAGSAQSSTLPAHPTRRSDYANRLARARWR